MFFSLARRIRVNLEMLIYWLSRHALGFGITLLIVAFVVLFFWERMVVSIYPGHVGVLWRWFGGTVTSKVYDEGVHLVFPLNIMYLYNVRWQVLQRSVTALTGDGLEITVDLGLLYRVRANRAADLHQHVGEAYLEALIIPTMDAAVRHALGKLDVKKLYVEKEPDSHLTTAGEVDLFEKELFNLAKNDVEGIYLEVQDLSVRRLVLPDLIQAAIQRKREEEQLALLYEFRVIREQREADRKRIEAQGIRDFQDTITGGLTAEYLRFKGIDAMLELAKSSNAKVIVFGDKAGLPLLLGNVPFGASDQSVAK